MRLGLTGAAVLVAASLTAPGGPGLLPRPRPPRDHAATQRAMDAAVQDGVPGVAGQAKDKYGTWKGTSGVGNLRTKQPRSAHDRYRVGSITKTFVSTVLLQLEAEGRLSLDDKVEKWLPGVVHGNGHDGSQITLRQLLNHTSGIFNYTADEDFGRTYFLKDGFFEHRYDTAVARAAREDRHGPQAGLRAGHLLELLQHQLRTGRNGHREGHRPRVRGRDPAAHHQAARPARHDRPRYGPAKCRGPAAGRTESSPRRRPARPTTSRSSTRPSPPRRAR